MTVRGPARIQRGTPSHRDHSHVYLHAGDLYCAAAPAIISTVLGSCVAVCLWDRRQRMGGINHFMLPGNSAEMSDARFGSVAIDALASGMRHLGARDLVAKVFGGAAVLPWNTEQTTVGAQNVKTAEVRLRYHAIPIVSSRLGGTNGISIRFDTFSGEVALRLIAQLGVDHA